MALRGTTKFSYFPKKDEQNEWLSLSLAATTPSLRRRSRSLSLLSEESVSDPNKIPISLFSAYKRIQNTFAFSLSLRNVLKRQIFFYNLYMWNKLLSRSLSAFPCWLLESFSRSTHLLFSSAPPTEKRFCSRKSVAPLHGSLPQCRLELRERVLNFIAGAPDLVISTKECKFLPLCISNIQILNFMYCKPDVIFFLINGDFEVIIYLEFLRWVSGNDLYCQIWRTFILFK